MGNCESQFDCANYEGIAPDSQEWASLNSDPTILGWGSLTAFYGSAFLTVVAIFWGYFTNSVPGGLLTDIDAVIVEEWPRSFRLSHHRFRHLKSWFKSAWKYPRWVFFGTEIMIPQDLRTEALRRFVLQLSDQQHLVGPALLIGAVADSCNISQYEFTVVIALAWFSSITHLATLSVLEGHFRVNWEMAIVRVILMAVNLVLLCYGMIMGEFEYEDIRPTEYYQGVPLKCVLKAKWRFFKLRPVTIVMGLFVVYLFMARLFTLTLFGRIINWLEVDLQKITPKETRRMSTTLARTQTSFNNNDLVIEWPVLRDIPQHPFGMALQKAWVYVRYWRRSTRRNFERELSYLQVAKQMERDSNIHDLLELIRQRRGPRRVRYRLLFSPSLIQYYVGRISTTFASQLPALFFGLSYGLATVINLRVKAKNLPAMALGLDFGQIVNLLLLTLPILTAVETYFEFKHNALDISSPTTLELKRQTDTAVTEARAAQKNTSANQAEHPVKVNHIVSIKTMLRDEQLYRRQRHQNFLHLFDSKRGRKWLRMYFLLSCPLPIGLGVCLALVESSLMLIGLLVFSGSLLSFVTSVIGAIKEVIDATKVFDNRRHSAFDSPVEDLQHEREPDIQVEELPNVGGKAFGGDAVMDERVICMDDTLPRYKASEQQGEARKRLATGGDASIE